MIPLVARYSSSDELRDALLTEPEYGGLFYPTRKPLEVGDHVVIDLRLPELHDHLLMAGTVKWRQSAKRKEGVRGGLGIDFLPSEAAKWDHLRQLAAAKDVPANRKHRRFPSRLPVGWRIPTDPEHYKGTLSDIGNGGANVLTDIPADLEFGMPVLLELVPPGSDAAQVIEGRVAWCDTDSDEPALGVEFRCRDIGGKRRLRELVKRIGAGES